MSVSILQELMDKLGLKREDGEPSIDFRARLARTAGSLGDDEYNQLSNETKSWVDKSVRALNRDQEPLELEGVEDGEAEDGEAAATEDNSKEGSKPVDTQTATKAKAKAKTAPKAAKKAAAAPKAAKTAKTNGGSPGKPHQYAGKKLKVIAKENPHREGTLAHRTFEAYKGCSTVDEFLAACAKKDLDPGYLRSHVRDGHVSVS